MTAGAGQNADDVTLTATTISINIFISGARYERDRTLLDLSTYLSLAIHILTVYTLDAIHVHGSICISGIDCIVRTGVILNNTRPVQE